MAAARTEDLLEEIAILYAIVLRIARQVRADDEPMTATQRLALIEVAAEGPIRLRTLAERMDTTPATATRAVDALEDWRFVERRPAPGDKRGVLVVATARGRRWADRRRELVRRALEAIPSDAIPQRLVADMAKLNGELLARHAPDEVSGSSLLSA